MARLIPDTAFNDTGMTPGEKRITRAFYQNLDDSVIIWYQPKLQESRRPDLILYLPEVGLVLYEIKDWSLKNILNANADYWTIKDGENEKSVTNPFIQARRYFFNLKKQLEKESIFLSNETKHKGKIKLPIATAIMFPNIHKDSFLAKGLNNIIEERYIIFKEDVDEIRNSTHRKIIDKLKRHFEPWWPNEELTDEEITKLRAILYPEITSKQKDKGGKIKDIILDEYQEQVAKRLGAGHKIIRGIAGSGKSLVLCAKARLLLEEQPNWKILLTCYNISLASQLRYYIKSFFGMTDNYQQDILNKIDERIEIIHFHELCANIFKKEKLNFPKINRDQVLRTASFSNLQEHEIEAKLDEMESALLGQEIQRIASTRKLDLYDAILVDESQDFHPSWLKALLLLLNGKTNFLLLAEDPNQKIYPRTFSYKEAGIDVRGGGKIYNLPIGYRSTREIILPASRLVQTSNWDDFYKKYVEEESDPDLRQIHRSTGKAPIIIIKPHYEDVCEYIIEDIENKIVNGYNFSDFGIIYLTRKMKDALPKSQLKLFDDKNDIDYVGTIRGRLAAKNIPNYWLSQDRETKRQYDQYQNEVTITTLFSAKGLEFEVVYLVGLELYPWSKRNPRENASMIYVGMTRAKNEVHLLSTERTNLLIDLEKIIEEISNK